MSNVVNKMRIMGYALTAYLLIMEIIDNIVLPDDRKRKYSDKQILKLLVLLQISTQ